MVLFWHVNKLAEENRQQLIKAETQKQNLPNTNEIAVMFGAHTITQNRAMWMDAKTLAERGRKLLRKGNKRGTFSHVTMQPLPVMYKWSHLPNKYNFASFKILTAV